LTVAVPRILRHGAIAAEQLKQVLGDVVVIDPVSRPQEGLQSPGMMSRHYAPQTKIVLSQGREAELVEVLHKLSQQKVGVLLPSGWNIRAAATFDWGRWGDWATLASRLYAGLRWLDDQMLDVMVAPLPPQEALGATIRERLLKASGREFLRGRMDFDRE